MRATVTKYELCRRDGFGTLTWPGGEGRQYCGEWEGGVRAGYGVMLYGREGSYEVNQPADTTVKRVMARI